MWLYVSRGKYGGKKTTVKTYAKIRLWGGGGLLLLTPNSGSNLLPNTFQRSSLHPIKHPEGSVVMDIYIVDLHKNV